MRALGIDTSNYTTSAAVFDGGAGVNEGRLLDAVSYTHLTLPTILRV